MDTLKSSVQAQILDFTSKIDQFHEKWQKLFPIEGNSDSFDRMISLVADYRQEWNVLMTTKSKMK